MSIEQVGSAGAGSARDAGARAGAARRDAGAAGEGARVPLVDAMRGIGVIAMLAWHSAEGWLAPEARSGVAWALVEQVGGLAAPAFLLLAGSAVALARGPAGGQAPRASRRALACRGIHLILAGYGLRLGLWAFDSFGLARPGALPGALAAAAGLSCLALALGRLGRPGLPSPRALGLAAAGLAATLLGYGALAKIAPHRIDALLRVDVLHAIGASACVLALLDLGRRPRLSVGLGAAWLVITPGIVAHAPVALPNVVGGFIGAPSAHAAFPLVPWAAYAMLGAGATTWLSRSERPLSRATTAWLLAATLAVGALACEWLPAAQAVIRDAPQLTELVRATFRCGVLGSLGCALALASVAPRRLVDLGRASLLLYCTHLEPTYGMASRPFRRALDWGGWTLGFLLLVVAAMLVAHFRRDLARRWRRGVRVGTRAATFGPPPRSLRG